MKQLRARVAKAPESPGIYRWLDEAGNVIYVGKAKNLRSRLKSYVNVGAEKGLGPWKQSMLQQLADFDITVTTTELEALILETNLIKKMRPKYNVSMKDDKNYVYVRVSVEDRYPKVEITRTLELNPTSPRTKDGAGLRGARYFGPYLSNFDTKRVLDMLHEFVGWRACKQSIDVLNKAVMVSSSNHDTSKSSFDGLRMTHSLKPCLDSQIGQCNGLCRGLISPEEYRSRIDQVVKFLRGDYKPVLARGRELMAQYAAEKKFEKASRMRDGLKCIEQMEEQQIVADTSGDDTDAVAVALLSGKAQVEVMLKRGGKLIGEHHLSLMGRAESIADVLDQFLPQYYETVVELPDTILVSEDFSSRAALEVFLSLRHPRKVHVVVPERGKKSQLLDLAMKNAEEKAKQAEASWEAEERNVQGALDELTKVLVLSSVPKRIEGYDISHTGGTETVGSMVVFEGGRPKNDQYRSFTIHSMQRGAIDDYRALKEVLARRLRHITGGLKMEEKRWAEEGITIGKLKKSEQGSINCFVARHEQQIVASGCFKKAGSLITLTSIWVSDEYASGTLPQFLIRTMLRSVKKGKVYVVIDPSLEQSYGTVGFRHVLKVSPALTVPSDHIVMVYDTLQQKSDSSLPVSPSLLVIDGGKGQLNAVLQVLREFQLVIPVIGLAKREEEVFVPARKNAIILPRDSGAKFMLMRLRDEAHRFANRGREKRALKHAVESQLDRIPSLGPETKQKLLREFGSVDIIKRQPDETLREILSAAQIQAVRKFL